MNLKFSQHIDQNFILKVNLNYLNNLHKKENFSKTNKLTRLLILLWKNMRVNFMIQKFVKTPI